MALTATSTDHQLAADIATEAGELLGSQRAHASGRAGGARADVASHRLILERLAEARPDDAVLSEEGLDGAARLDAERVWIVDPLDGTREYTEPGRTDWAVHIALVVGGQPVAGAVALPALGVTYSTADPPTPPPRDPDRPLRLALSRTRRPARVLVLAEALGAELVEMGSAGAKAMAVVRGEVDVYAHDGGQYEWDSAAPVAVALAAGLHASRLDGSPLRYNRPDPYLPDLLINHDTLAERLQTRAARVVGR